MLMKRMILLLTVAAFMAATLAVNAGPAWAQNSDEDTWCEKIKPAPEERNPPIGWHSYGPGCESTPVFDFFDDQVELIYDYWFGDD